MRAAAWLGQAASRAAATIEASWRARARAAKLARPTRWIQIQIPLRYLAEDGVAVAAKAAVAEQAEEATVEEATAGERLLCAATVEHAGLV